LIVPETTLSGTGLAGIETSVMESQWDRRKALKIKGQRIKNGSSRRA
jgi:hypothetical protein